MKLNYFALFFSVFLISGFIGNRTLAQVTADFTADKTSGCAPLQVQFTDKSTPSDNVTWEWTLGNNNTSPYQNPLATYSTEGTYTVTLKATRNGQSSTKSMSIRVFKNPVANFSTSDNKTKGCVPFLAQFSDNTVEGDTTIQSWLWLYDTGASSTLRQQNYTFNNEGKYNIFLKVIDNHGCENAITKNAFIDVAEPPRVNFHAEPVFVCKTETIKFVNDSRVTGTSTPIYLWIADKMVATTKDANFFLSKYDTTYTIKLTVTDQDYGCSSNNQLDYRIDKVKAIGTIKQSGRTISATNDIVCAGSVSFESTSLPVGGLNYWDFDNGEFGTYDPNGNYVFKVTGSLTPHIVKLISSPGSNCADTMKWTFNVEKVTPEFTINPDATCKSSATVTFTNTSSVNASSFQWKFGNGNTSLLKDPINQVFNVPSDINDYAIHGAEAFNNKLIATTINGCKDSVMHSFTIKRPTALFSVDTLSGCTNLNVTFTDRSESDSTIVSRDWDFGDGNTSHQTTATTIQHTYLSAGIFSAKLTITTSGGCSDASYVIPIRIGTPPNANFSVTPGTVCQPDLITITDATPPADKPDYWYYSVNGTSIGNCTSEKSPSFTFKPDVGTLAIKQIVGYNGCFATKVINITNNGPISKFDYEVVDCLNPYRYKFTNNSVGATSHSWDFGDGNTDNTANPTHDFPNSPADKDYTVTYTTSNGTGCSNVVTQIVKVRKKGATFATPAAPTWEVCAGQPVLFDASGSHPLDNICQDKNIWNFNDTTPLIRTDVDQVNHTFKYRGSYKVLLSTVHDNGCTDTVSHRIRVYRPFSGLKSDKVGGCPGTQIKFTDMSTPDVNPIVKLYMDYGDMNNEIAGSAGSTFKHTYYSQSVYYPYVKAIDSKGCYDSTFVTIGIEQPVVTLIPSSAQNSGNSNDVCVNSTVTFTQTAMEPDSMVWNFGDGVISKEKAPFLDHIFLTPDTFVTKIKVYKFGCSDSAQITMRTQKADASFTVSDSVIQCENTPIKFVRKFNPTYITGGGWNTGEKEYITTDSTITYFYKNPGIYTSKLEITTSFTCKDTKTQTIRVMSPGAQFDVSPKQACVKDLITFTMRDTMNLGKYSWDFGDGTFDLTGLNPKVTHKYETYDSIRKKYVYLNINNPVGNCPKSRKDSILLDGIVAKFSVKDTAGCDGEPVVFTNLSKDQTNQTWNFSDGPVSYELTPEHLFKIGTYPIILSVSNAAGCRDTARRTLTIKRTPGITVSMTSCTNKVAHLHATGGNYVNWWPKQGLDDSTSYDPIATPVGSLYYKARVTNVDGKCTKTDSILIIRPQASFSEISHVTKLDTTIYVGTTLQINVYDTSSVKAFHWDPVTYLSCTDCLNPVAKPTESMAYYLVLTEPSNCFTDSLKVNVLLKFGDLKFSAPDAFKPNDAVNGLFKVYSQAYMELVEFKIYNRWGNVVFTSTQGMDLNGQKGYISKEGWDGKYQGKDQPIDTYIWVATARMFSKEGTVLVKNKGTLLLVR
jgi:PKD repeat protein